MSLFQSQVYTRQGLGIPGEIYNDSPMRVQPFVLDTPEPILNYVGRAYTVVSEGIARCGGATTGPGKPAFAGILISPKSYVSNGTVDGTLEPTLVLPNGTVGELANMGTLVVRVNNTGQIGDWVGFDENNGELRIIAPNTTPPAGIRFANAIVSNFDFGTQGLAVIDLLQAPNAGV